MTEPALCRWCGEPMHEKDRGEVFKYMIDSKVHEKDDTDHHSDSDICQVLLLRKLVEVMTKPPDLGALAEMAHE